MNKSNIIHALAALVIQFPFGLAGYAEVGGAFAVGIMVGIEWMQQISMNLKTQGRPWPDSLSLKDIADGFRWEKKDRYMDVVLPLIAVCAAGVLYGSR